MSRESLISEMEEILETGGEGMVNLVYELPIKRPKKSFSDFDLVYKYRNYRGVEKIELIFSDVLLKGLGWDSKTLLHLYYADSKRNFFIKSVVDDIGLQLKAGKDGGATLRFSALEKYDWLHENIGVSVFKVEDGKIAFTLREG